MDTKGLYNVPKDKRTMSWSTMDDYTLPPGKCVHEIFEQQVLRTPHHKALVFGDNSLTYAQLNKKANQLAHHIFSFQLAPESLIAICLDRSPEMFIGLLAIQKAGAAYVPIDPAYPSDRIAFMLQDTETKLLLTQKHLVASFPRVNQLEILVLDESHSGLDTYPSENPEIDVQGDHLIYTIYTSGSTGRPKGVQVEHRSVVNLVAGQLKFVKQPVGRFLYAYSFAFDGAVLLIYWTLLQGGTLVIAADGLEKDVQQFAAAIQDYKITHLLTFPSVYSILLEKANRQQLASLISVSVAGEACPANMVRRHHERLQNVKLLNQYGPTEATVGATIYQTTADHQGNKVPIGQAIKNVSIYVLDNDLKECPTGTTGEIYIGGVGVARGYLNRPELIKEKFIDSPFGEGRIYKTGDLGTWLASGELDFVGRADFQVKLRGYRIELGEIEAVLLQHGTIREAVVEVKGETSANKKLIAYLVLNAGAKNNVSTIRQILTEQLPEYMIPAQFVFLDQMPLATSGKIDRKALPEPPTERPALEQTYRAPQTDLQKTIALIWEQVLDISPIGIHDKFFELGGNSLQAAQVITYIQDKIGETIFIVAMFEYPTISEFAEMLEQDYLEALHNITHRKENKKTDLVNTNLSINDFEKFDRCIPLINPVNKHKQNTSLNPPALFILAPPRSGTTLLRVMLAGHPDLFAANELQLLGFRSMSERREAYAGKFSLWSEGLIRTIMELQSVDADQARAIITEMENNNFSIQQTYQYLQSIISPKILVDKSPSYALDVDALNQAEAIFDNALYIQLVRHPYAMVSSFAKMHMDQAMYLHPHSFNAQQTGELIWTRSHENINTFFQSIPGNRKFRLRYEDLVTQPEKTMRALCQQLNIEFNDALIDPYRDINKKMTDGIYDGSKPMGDPKLLGYKKIDPTLADAWKGVIENNFLHKKTWSLALDFGYPEINKKEEKIVANHESKNVPKENVDDLLKNDLNSKFVPIAIVGMAVRLPGAKNTEEFWENLIQEKDVSRSFSDEELRQAGISAEEINDPDYVKRGMVLDHHDCFDAQFFGYTPKEAALMDPQHRIYLQVAYAALSDAGYDPDRYDGKVGVFGGVARNTYLVNNVMTHPNYFKSIEDFTKGVTLEKDFPATRVAYKLNLKGPGVNVQTACSSSGVAVHLACQSLMSGDSDMVIVGGGRIQPPVTAGHLHTDGHALSPDGYCRPFDASADGMVRGNGMSFIVLKKLSDAQKDGDTIHAVIRGTAINNDGADKTGFTAPSVKGQSEAIRLAYERAGFSPETVSYLEAHGTGTRIGDPIEIAGLTKAFNHFTKAKDYCAIGSVKSNIGHLDAGACVTGIIKTVLSLKHQKIPATLHFRKPNPQINFKQTPFFVNHQLRDWKRGTELRRAGVSSFGLGGTNAHVVLEEAPQCLELSGTTHDDQHLILLSTKTENALERMINDLGVFVVKYPQLDPRDIGYTLQNGRQVFNHRAYIIADSVKQISEKLIGQSNEVDVKQTKGFPTGLAFLFPGGGAQHTNMGLELYRREPVFKSAVDECLNILSADHQLELFTVLYPEEESPQSKPILDSLHAITLLFTIEYATAKLWLSRGVEPTALIGHSLGEYTAACLAGVFSLRDAIAMVAKRGKLFKTLEKGGMMSVALSEVELEPYLNGKLDIAAINKPDQCVVSGADEQLTGLKIKLAAADIQVTRLHINVAAHSRMVEPILSEFEQLLKQVNYSAPSIPIVSNLTGDWVDENEIQQPAYWLKHLRQTVRFAEGIEKLLKDEGQILLEVGPGQTLSTFTRQHPARSKDQVVLASLRHPKERIDDQAFLLKTMGRLWQANVSIDWSVMPGRRISLPTYSFELKRHWIDAKPITEEHGAFPFQQHLRSRLENTDMEQKIFTRKDLLVEKIADIFHQLSGIPPEEMDPKASFLELGFDSLFLTQATSKIKKQLKIKLNFRQLFEEAPNLSALADYADQQLADEVFQDEVGQRNQQVAPVVEQPTVQSPVAPPAPQSTPPPASVQPVDPAQLSNIESIVHRQLGLMEQQLRLLGAAPSPMNIAPTPPAKQQPPIQSSEASKPKVEPTTKSENGKKSSATNPITRTPAFSPVFKQVNMKDDGKAFGPWKPIDKQKDADGLTQQQRQYLDDLISRYTTRTKGSQQLAQTQRVRLADPRSITGFNRLWKDMVYQIAADRSAGAKFWDVDGNEYVDYRMAFGISLFGHSMDFVKEAVREQLEKGFELGVNTPLAKKVAELLAELTGMDRVTLVNTGSEALSASIRVARTATGKDKLIVFEGDYHGIIDEMLFRPVKMKDKTIAMPVAPGIPNNMLEHVIVLNYDDPDVLEKIKAYADDTAAVIIEPVQPNNPCRQPRELIHQIRALCSAEDMALIFDEMITGFRVAMRGAQEWYNVDADIVAYGKIISGGLPMAAVAGKRRFMDCFDGGKWQFGDDSYPEVGVTFFGGTFVKHPLSLVASYAALSEIKKRGPEIYDELNAKTARLAERLKDLFLQTKAPLRIHSTASILSIKVTDKNPLSRLFFYYVRLKGVHLKEKAGLVCLAHTEEDLDFTYRVIEESIREMQTAGFFQITLKETVDQNKIVYPPNRLAVIEDKKEYLKQGIKKKIPLTEGQQEVWIEQRLGNEAAAAYNMSSDIRLKGKLNIENLEQAVKILTDRHEALRVHFDREEPMQYIAASMHIPIEQVDLSKLEIAERTHELNLLRERETTSPLDLFNGPLLRIQLIKLEDKNYHLLLTVHHAVADGWSVGVLVNDLSAIYTKLCNGESINDLETPPQLSEFVEQQIEFQQSEEYQETATYWAEQFKDGVPVLELPTDRSRRNKKTYDADLERITIPAAVTKKMKALATAEKTTTFILLYTAFQTFLHRLSHQEDFVLGLVAAGQTIAGNENLIAHGVSLLPVRTKTKSDETFQVHLKQMREQVLDAFDHQQYTLGSLVRQLKLQRDPSRQPMISVLFNMDSAMGSMTFGELEVEMQPIQRKYETFDSFINVKPLHNNDIIFEWIYNTDLFDAETIKRRLTEFVKLLNSIVEQPSEKIGRLDLLPPGEIALLKSWNDNYKNYPQDICVHTRISEQAEKTPGRTAVISGSEELTYQQLQDRSDQVAALLIEQGVEKGKFVGVFMERSVDLIIGLLATIKVGGIYVPLDPANPLERLSVIADDAQAEFILTHRPLKKRAVDFSSKIILIEEAPKNKYVQLPVVHASDFAYVNYTSGSSGKPKGVLIPHYSVIDHHSAILDALGANVDEKIYSVASVAFDPSVQDFFMPLFIGATVVVAKESVKTDGFLLKEDLERHLPTLMQATPSTWRMLISAGWKGHKGLTILCGGEGLNKELANQLIERSGRLYNIYGPTETTIWSTLKLLTGDRMLTKASSGYEPVGQPINNVQIYLLDKYMNPVPVGVAGEIYIGGVGVAPEGYFKRPELTTEKFIDNPFEDRFGGKLYRTGDMARYLSNGDLEYLNRADNQVKIRGFRIELGEIESALSQHPQIKENVVVIREDQTGNKRLVAYLVPSNGKIDSGKLLKNYLRDKLPEYMLPSAFIPMAQFPLTATLKINRNLLPEPEYKRDDLEESYEAPQNEQEQLLTTIWSELLGLDQIGVHDNFFELGGHSILAVKMMAKIEKQTGKKLPLSVLLEHSTIRRLSYLMEEGQQKKSEYLSLTPIKSTGSKPPIYLVHGAGLHVLMYEMLSRYMDEDQPIYAMQARGLNGEAEPLSSIEDIAAHYIKEILQHNPNGPYSIAGYSFGGLIAFEMGKQLKAMGKELLMLGVFDTVVRKSITGQSDSYYDNLKKKGKKVAWNLSMLAQQPMRGLKYKSKSLQMYFKRLRYSTLQENKKVKDGEVDYAAIVDQKNKEAFGKYRITAFDGALHLFRAKEKRFFIDDFEFLGWRPFIEKKIHIHEVPGDHLHLFDPPNGDVFAKILQEVLNAQLESYNNKKENSDTKISKHLIK